MIPRVTLLDAYILDDHIAKIFTGQTLKIFKYLPTWILNNFELEVKAILQFLLTYYSVSKVKATFGQQLLGIQFNQNELTETKLALFQLFTVGADYVKLKVESPTKNFFNNINDFKYIVNVLKAVSFLNFLLFLQQGKYPTLPQRILGLSQELTRKRNIEYNYMARELLWHGFSEFLVFTLPLINYQSVKHKITRFINSTKQCDKKSWTDKMPLISARTVCSICNEKPVLPHHIKCSHVFCFYCISSMRMVDEKFECPECFHFENDILPVVLNN